MISSTLNFRKPTTILTSFPPLESHKPIISSSRSVLAASNLVFSGKYFPQSNYVSFKNRGWSPYFMKESIKTRVLKGSSGDEDIGALEQEAFVDGSSDFSPNLTANGLQYTLNHMSKWFVTLLFGTIILWRHDAEALWAALGSILNAGFSNILKQILNQERPVSTLRPVSASDPGMPSSHAQAIFYAVAFAILSMVEWLGLNGLTIMLIGILVAVGSYFSWLRVAQEFHTLNQVAVGAVVGSIFSILWFWSWDAIVLKLFISYLWVRIFLVVGSVGCCIGFLLYVIRYWVIGAQQISD